MKHFAFLSVLTLGSATLPAFANDQLTILQRQVELSDARIAKLEAQVATLTAALNKTPVERAQVTAPTPAPATSSAIQHTLKRGETVAAVARQYKVTPGAIIAHNKISDPRKLQVGTKLVIPAQNATVTSASPVAVGVLPPKSQPGKPVAFSSSNYTVVKGDTLYGIARRTGVPLWKLQRANPSVDPAALRPGTKLNLTYDGPKAAPTKRSAPQPAPPAGRQTQKPEQKKATKPGANNQKRQQKAKPVNQTAKPKPAETQRSAAKPKFEDPSEAIRIVTVKRQMTYGQFAAKHRTSVKALNELNGLSLSSSTQLPVSSELYVPGR